MKETENIIKGRKSSKAGVQTLFRVTYRTQVNLVRIADSKANMILGINTMVISILVGIISSKVIFSSSRVVENIELAVPVVFFMLSALISSIYAIRSARPRLIRAKNMNQKGPEPKKSILFFENIYSMSHEEYLQNMKQLVYEREAVYENMITDIYNQAKVLHRKYHLLGISYMVFMYGLLISILSFLGLWLFIR